MASLTIENFTGAISNNLKVGIPNSYSFSRNLTPYEDASYITLNPKTTKVSGSTVTDLVLWMADGSPYDTNRYFYGNVGELYKETSGGTWSNIRTVSNSDGQGLGVLDDYLYYAGQTTLGRYGRLTGTPAFSDNFLADGTTDLDQSQALTGNTYTPPTSISETATNRQSFIPTRDPISYIQVYVVAKGTGNWTITVHDSENNNLGSATVSNASLTNGALNSFTFSTPIRVAIGVEYHFHVTSTVADGTLRTGTASDLETSTYNEFFAILIDAEYHPIAQLLNGIVVGNDNYLAFWDQATYNPNQIQLEFGYTVRSLAKQDEFIVAAAWKGSGTGEAEEAKLYYWDGIQPTFNYAVPINVGLPNAIHTKENQMMGVFGNSGTLYMNTAPLQPVHQAPRLTQGSSIEVAPGAITEHNQRLAFGYAITTGDTSGLQEGVYEWGNKSDEFPDAFNFAYTISTGNVHNLSIGSVSSIGTDLYIGWKDTNSGTVYGVDKVAIDNDPFTSGEWVSLLFDDGNAQKPKYADILVINFEPLVSGESITAKYAIDANAYSYTFTSGSAVSTVGATQAVLPIGKRFNTISFGFNVATGTTYPKITSVYFLYSQLQGERNF